MRRSITPLGWPGTHPEARQKLLWRLAAPLLLRPPAPPRPRYLQPEPTKNAHAELLAALNKGVGVTAGTGPRAGNVRPEEKSPARNVEYFKNKQDNEVEVNQSVYVYKSV